MGWDWLYNPIAIPRDVIGGIGNFIGGGSDSAGDNFNSAQSFNASEAQKQRDFEERMFSTRHQVEVKDLLAAGLNPILSAGGQPPVPSGQSAASVQPDYSALDRKTRRAELLATSAQVASNVFLNKTAGIKNLADAAASAGTVGLPFGMGKIPISTAMKGANSAKMAGMSGFGGFLQKFFS